MNIDEAFKRVPEVLGDEYQLLKVDRRRIAIGRHQTVDHITVEVGRRAAGEFYGHAPWDFVYTGEGSTIDDALDVALGIAAK